MRCYAYPGVSSRIFPMLCNRRLSSTGVRQILGPCTPCNLPVAIAYF